MLQPVLVFAPPEDPRRHHDAWRSPPTTCALDGNDLDVRVPTQAAGFHDAQTVGQARPCPERS